MSQITFTNSGGVTDTSNQIQATASQTVTDNWTIPGGVHTIDSTYRRVGNNSTGYRVHWCMTFESFGVGVSVGIITSPVGSVPAIYRPNSPLGYIVLSGSGNSNAVTETLRILVTNTGQIAISRETGGNMTGNIEIGGWDLSWDTSMPDL